MIVLFASECEKNAIKTTRQILDNFANRIGSNTWKTRITMEGLKAVKYLLSKYATKSTAVACHRLATRNSTELMWIVGNKSKFGSDGICPTNYTSIDHLQDSENNWFLLPYIKSLTALASLFHDLGKSSKLFQEKLSGIGKIESDPVRHEWVTCTILKHFIGEAKTDEEWLSRLSTEGFKLELPKNKKLEQIEEPFKNLPPFAAMLMWLIISHHRLPIDKTKTNIYLGEAKETPQKVIDIIKKEFDYPKLDSTKDVSDCFYFPKGLPVNNPIWDKQVKKWASKALGQTEYFKKFYEEYEIDNKVIRVILHFARLGLMLGDHYFSSKNHNNEWKESTDLIANSKCGQFLDEHLVGVCEQALKIVHTLPRFENEMPLTSNTKRLRRRSNNERYSWQDKAVDKILEDWVKKEDIKNRNNTGFFALNMASTGCGKTLANAKIMRLLSSDRESLRYILALGLRTLTLQTGDAYREKIGLDDSELAVIIGSNAVKSLYNIDKENEKSENNNNSDLGSESSEEIFPDILDFENNSYKLDFLEAIIPEKKPNHRKLLYAPVLVCTIDHLMSAVESTRGGHHILPSLRLMSSDLVIDEIDDFSGNDLIAISRLVFLTGMLGRKVMLSSATIPPDLAYGLFYAYKKGYKIYCQSRNIETERVCCAWIDEFRTSLDVLSISNDKESLTTFKGMHEKFIDYRCRKISESIKLRHGYIAELPEKATVKEFEEIYFNTIKENILKLHSQNCEIYSKENIKINISCGVVRMANITPCAEFGKYLLNTEFNENICIKSMIYHSQQILIMRHIQEKFLDDVLKRDNKKHFYDNPSIKADINKLPDNITDLIYVVVATPVEEIGRDHDFDWAVIEPSSFRSIIQMAGRIRRHRSEAYSNENIAVMQYNYKGYKNKSMGKGNDIVFLRPGYEESSRKALKSHNLSEIIDEENDLKKGITSIPRINKPKELKPNERFSDLEHFYVENGVGDVETKEDNQGPENPLGWIDQCWWLTAFPQVLVQFRKGTKSETYYLIPKDNDNDNTKFDFCEKVEEYGCDPRYVAVGDLKNIKQVSLNVDKNRIWFDRDYFNILSDSDYSVDGDAEKTAQKYGFIDVNLYNDVEENFEYNPIYGLIKKR